MKKRVWFTAAICMLVLAALSLTAQAAAFETLQAGDYQIEASLSCYVNAMGGIEFGEPLLTGAVLHVAQNGDKTVTLKLTKSQVSIYSVTCDTFVDASPDNGNSFRGVENGTIGYYTPDGALITETVQFTLASDTAENAAGQQVHYVNSITFPITEQTDEYHLTLYINSNVMGVQFCEANDSTTENTFPGILHVDWQSVGLSSGREETTRAAASSDSSNVQTETKRGLNLYRVADETTQPETEDTQALPTSGLITTFNRPVVYSVGAAGCALLLCGAVLILLGRRDAKCAKKSHKSRGAQLK